MYDDFFWTNKSLFFLYDLFGGKRRGEMKEEAADNTVHCCAPLFGDEMSLVHSSSCVARIGSPTMIQKAKHTSATIMGGCELEWS